MITRVLSGRPIATALTATLTTALAISAAGCGSAASPPVHTASTPAISSASGAFPVTIAAANGAVQIARRPAAIISLSPSVTEMLYAIGAGSQVKAVDQNSDYPPGVPRTQLSGITPNVEAIVADKPDLVVVTDDAATLTTRLAAFGVPVLELPAPVSLGGVYSEFDQLGLATGHERQARGEVASLRAKISRIIAAVPRHARPLTYYYELDQTYYSVTSDTFLGKLLSLLGMTSIADAAKGASDGYPQLSAEYILRANPDYIILADTICCRQNAATVAARPGWSTLAAVKEKHVIALNDDIASRWGPRIVVLLATVLAAIQGTR
jgi:iron complex transport system substrate-binding protein